MFNHLHQIEAVLKTFNSIYLGLVLLQDKASIRRVNQGTHKQKKSTSKLPKSSDNRHKTMLALPNKTSKNYEYNNYQQ